MSRRRAAADRREAHPCDLYSTPAWCIRRLLDRIGVAGLGLRWLEPAVGEGAIVRAVDEWRAERGCKPLEWTTMDIRPETGADVIGDFTGLGRPLLDARGDRWDVAITNPPYTQADAFVAEAMERARVVVLLLRLNWLAGARHAEWLRAHPPTVLVLPDRPSFTGSGTDATDYGWFLWHGQSEGRVEILQTTSLGERRS